MVNKPDIVKKLRDEEKLGTIESSSQGSHEELEFSEELPKNTSDENTEFFKEEFENREVNTEPIQHSSLSVDSSVDKRELLFQSTSDLMLYLDKHGKIAKINKAGIAFSGFSEDEIIGQFFWKLPGVFSKHNLSKYLKVFKNALKGKPTESFLCELQDKSGKKHVMDFSTYPIKENEKLASILVVAKDVTEQKETEDKYRLIIEKTSDLITTVTFTLNPIFTYISPSHKKAIGYEASDLIGKPLFDFVHPDDRRKLFSLLKKYISAKAKKLLTRKEAEVYEKVEIRFRDKSGNWRYMETTANLIGNEIVSVSREVTERRKAEEELRLGKDRLQDLIDGLNQTELGIDIVDMDYKILSQNQFLKERFGDCTGKLCYKEYMNLENPCDFCPMEKAIKSGKVEKMELTAADGSVYELLSAPLTNPDGTVDRAIETVRDITDRKQAEAKLIEREKELRFITESSLDTIFTLTKTGKIAYISLSSKELFGFEPSEMIGTSFTKYVTEAELPKYWKALKDVIVHKKIPDFETYVKHRNGNIIPVEINGLTVEREGELVAQGAIRDITERKNAEEKVKESEERLKTILENLQSGIAIVDTDTHKIVDVNPLAVKMIGVPKEKIVGKICHKFICPSENGKCPIIDLGQKIDNSERVLINADGKEVPILKTAISVMMNNHEYLVESFVDITERKNAEEEIKNLAKFPSENPNPVMRISKDGTILYSNDAGLVLLKNRGTDIGKPVPDEFKEFVKKAYESNQYSTTEFTSLGRTNSYVLSPVKEGGYVNVYGTDITEKKKSEESLKESEERYRNIVETAPDAIITIDLKGTITSCNQAALDIVGYTRDEYVGRHFSKLGVFHKRDALTLAKLFFSVIRGKQIAPYEFQFIHKDGSARWAEGRYKLQEKNGKAIGLQAIIRDITDRKSFDKALRKSEEKFRTFVDTASDLMDITDKDGNITDVNEAMTRTLGYTKEKMIGMHITQILTKESLENDFKPNWKKFVKNGKISIETTLATKDGKEIYGELKAVAIYDSDGKYLGSKTVFHNLTERKKAEEKIREQNIQLKKLDELKTSFLNITSHELRTPMSAIKGYTQMMLKQTLGETSEEQKQSLNVILRNTDRLDDLIKDILDVSRLESGTMKFVPEKTDVKTVVEQTVETMLPSANRKKITINADVEKGTPYLFVDEERIKQVVVNLVNNAIKFSPDGSIININAKEEKKDILIEIQDFGRGIPKDKVDKVFETFYQVDSKMDRKFGGAGLGLAISKGIIVSHGGRIWVESREGKGSIFKFTIPVKPVKDLEERFKEVDMFLMENGGEDRK